MSIFIQMPFSLIQLKTKSNFNEVYTYFLIRSQIKDNSYTASISEKELMDKVGVTKNTLTRYIKDLKDYFENISKRKTSKEFPYNVYKFTCIDNNYSIISPDLINNTELTAEQKGILIKIKLLCEKGTNFVKFQTKAELIKKIGISVNLFNKKLTPLIQKGYLSYLNNSLQLTQKYFPLFVDTEDILNFIYKTIYDYCLINKVCPPLRDNTALSYLAGHFPERDDELITKIKERCSKLPKEISLDYFVEALENKRIERSVITDYGFIIE